MQGALDPEKTMFQYHDVFATSLAAYFMLRKEIASQGEKGLALESRKNEARSIVRSNIIYAVMLKKNDPQNKDVKSKTPRGIVEYLKEKEDEFSKIEGFNQTDCIDALFALMVDKQEVAGLTANSEKHFTSRMNMQISGGGGD